MIRRNRRRRRHTAGLARPGELRMTSMMDIFVVLLLFLLKSFVVGGEAVVPPPGLELPESTAESPPRSSLLIAIDGEAILLGDERVASIEDVAADDDLLIEALDERLQHVIARREEIAALRRAETLEEEIVTIQGDRRIEFRVLERVLYTLGVNGFENVSLAVVRGA